MENGNNGNFSIVKYMREKVYGLLWTNIDFWKVTSTVENLFLCDFVGAYGRFSPEWADVK